MDEQKIMQERLHWYGQTAVQYEIVKALRGREASFLNPIRTEKGYPIRCMKIHNVAYLASNMKAFHFFERPYNFYHSIALLKDMPMFTFHPFKRVEQQQEFNKNFKSFMVGYDLPLDFDIKNRSKVTSAVKEIIILKEELLDEFRLPYTIKSSGSGFHIEIPSEYLDGVTTDPMEKVKVATKVAENLKTFLSSEFLDLSIYDERRVWKTPYTIDVKTGNVALPLDDEQLERFSYDMLKPDAVLRNNLLRGRGMLLRNFTTAGKDRFTKFYKEITEGW